MTIIQTNQIRIHKSKHVNSVKKELSEDDKARLQAFDEDITNGFRKAVSRNLSVDEEEAPQREIQTERPRRYRYNNNKYKEVLRETAYFEPEQFVMDIYLSHLNLLVKKFISDCICKNISTRKRGENFIFNPDNCFKLRAQITQKEEKDIEILMEEPLMRYNGCDSKIYKKIEIVRVDDVLIKNVSISNIDNVLWNSIEKLYRVNKDFVRLSDKLESDIGPNDF